MVLVQYVDYVFTFRLDVERKFLRAPFIRLLRSLVVITDTKQLCINHASTFLCASLLSHMKEKSC